jgi:DNA-binding winged helix-turn-helix (wHTH) protein
LKKKVESVEIGIDYERQKAKYYLTQQHKKLRQLLNNKKKKNDFIQTFLQGFTPTESTEGDQEKKTGQETFSTTKDITRNLGKKQCRKGTCFR